MTLCILGRQPALGLAELEQQFGSDNIRPIKGGFADVNADIDLNRLGGSVKIAKHLTTLQTTNPQKVFDYCRRELPRHLEYVPEGKLKLGVSIYGLDMPVAKINANMLSLKKVVKAAGRSVRVIPNTESALSSAQTYHNKLASELGVELVFIRDGASTLLGQVTGVQNIDAYAARDQARPKTDAFVGMLPPKLAQIMINLAHPTENARVLDPFCGTGVVLQEAALMGYDVYGTDLSDKMIDYSRVNLAWAKEKYHLENDIAIEQGDAMTTEWHLSIDAVAAETYLGQPFSAPPSTEKLAEVKRTVDHITSSFLKNLAKQIKQGTPLCIAIPAWRDTHGNFTHLDVINKFDSLGYARQALQHVSDKDLLYYREDQVVARQLLVLKKL
ncbi:MAG TPA: methyltransferase domain-containing protein [Candidatus Saccharimonadales bacterium]